MRTVSIAVLTTVLTFFSTPTCGTQQDDSDDARTIPSYQAFGSDTQQIIIDSAEQYGCSFACSFLHEQFGGQYVLTPNGSSYDTFRKGYWSQFQTAVYPACVFTPPTSDAVSALVRLAQESHCPFAVMSGGHGAFNGASSISEGITVSMQHLNGIELSKDKKIASVGPGNTWADVYSTLGKSEVTVIGGRVERVGVGGLTLGGGLSFFSGFHGWACDNVEAYSVIIATGEMVTASPTEHPDLYWALRGGGNNFGIVTTFHLRTVPLPNNVLWAGARTYMPGEYPKLTQAFTNLAINADQDPGAGHWTAFLKYNGTKMATTMLWYDSPSNISHTKILDEFNDLTSVADDTKTRDLVELVELVQLSNPYVEIFYSAVDASGLDSSAFPVLVFQSITTPMIANMAQNGGNPLGLHAEEGPLFIIHVPSMWDNASDDEAVHATLSLILHRISVKAKEMGLLRDYIYMNYASKFQDVFKGYGSANKARLIEIANTYDPEGVFQKLQPGHFKLNGPPVDSEFFSGSWSL